MGRVVLITGCRSGFGLATARDAAKRGWTVYAGLRDVSTAPAFEGDVRPVQLDVTLAEDREAAIVRITREAGRLDGLVNNAGRPLGGFLETIDEDELRDLFEVNVFGTWAMTRAALPLLRQSAPSTIVMVSSTSGLLPLPGLGAYASSKFAIEGMAESWRHELRPFGVRVALVEPGAFRTEIFARNRRVARHAHDADSPYAPWTVGLLDRFDATVQRMARDPSEVGARIVQLLEHPHPPLRNPIGPTSTTRDLLRRLAPFGLVEAVVQAVMRRAKAS